MSNIKKICEEVVAAGEGALVTPYDEHCMIGIFKGFDGDKETRRYLRISANHADKLARALLVMNDAMTSVQYKLNHNDSLIISRALTQAEDLLK